MRCASIGVSWRLRWGTYGLVSALALMTVTAGPADARHRKHAASHARGSSHASHAAAYTPPYADFVLDMNSGAVLHATNADSLRHPASLTKMMTLYLLFERLEAGKIALDSRIEVSAHAAAQAPSKLGLRAGQSIAVEDAIKAVVTKSANDIAVAIGETLGGDEETFAEMMTRKAHALGMSHTQYRNACGLPDDEQVTTARDQATLARALQERFPRYYRYFSTPVFHYHGEAMRNHNHLLGRVDGVDGIKTGYIRASGFNLVTSLRRGNRHIVGVVFGGSSAGSRDAKMRQLIEEYVQVASARKTAPVVADAPETQEPRRKLRVVADAVDTPAEISTAAIAPAWRAAPTPQAAPAAQVVAMPIAPAAASAPARVPDPASTAGIPAKRNASDPIRPILVKTVTVKAGAVQTAAGSAAAPAAQTQPPGSQAGKPVDAPAGAPPPPPGARPGILGMLPVHVAAAGDASEPAQERPTAHSMHARGGYLVQVGAFGTEMEAKERLTSARTRARDVLGAADPFTERAQKGDKSIFRARFAGLDKEQAEAACRSLKRSDIPCMALKN